MAMKSSERLAPWPVSRWEPLDERQQLSTGRRVWIRRKLNDEIRMFIDTLDRRAGSLHIPCTAAATEPKGARCQSPPPCDGIVSTRQSIRTTAEPLTTPRTTLPAASAHAS